ncbi:ArsC family reductase [Aestuariispira insulae]|uniref:Spx/MgsR family transcriptional regulator n=1 Tax=Aestuariispira insulae TaxID=1461337 RepID=A0A3D9HK25_9PROT|nr:ArsC family reductase [Aestuariispira insulae]RED49828.1 Spx/MgsR family transcriptional regulator [Aestuariispira insulae]
MSTTLYGLKNCDTCRKARKWLDAEGIDHQFHDVRADGLDRATVAAWAGALGWGALLNRRGTTWRGLSEDVKAGVDEAIAIDLMTEHPALIKRPVFDINGTLGLGFPALQKTVQG